MHTRLDNGLLDVGWPSAEPMNMNTRKCARIFNVRPNTYPPPQLPPSRMLYLLYLWISRHDDVTALPSCVVYAPPKLGVPYTYIYPRITEKSGIHCLLACNQCYIVIEQFGICICLYRTVRVSRGEEKEQRSSCSRDRVPTDILC